MLFFSFPCEHKSWNQASFSHLSTDVGRLACISLLSNLEEFIWLFMLFVIAGTAAVFFIYKCRPTKAG